MQQVSGSTTDATVCADCGTPFSLYAPRYWRTDAKDGQQKVYHANCGDPLGIKAAVQTERERCARIAAKWPDLPKPEHPWAEGYASGYQAACNIIAEKIRDADGQLGNKTHG